MFRFCFVVPGAELCALTPFANVLNGSHHVADMHFVGLVYEFNSPCRSI